MQEGHGQRCVPSGQLLRPTSQPDELIEKSHDRKLRHVEDVESTGGPTQHSPVRRQQPSESMLKRLGSAYNTKQTVVRVPGSSGQEADGGSHINSSAQGMGGGSAGANPRKPVASGVASQPKADFPPGGC